MHPFNRDGSWPPLWRGQMVLMAAYRFGGVL